MDDANPFNLATFCENCFESFSACTVLLPLAFLFTICAVLAPHLSLFSICAKSTTGLFGICHPLGVIQGFLLIRFSQGPSNSSTTDNDAVLFFTGIFILVASSVMFVIDFTQSLMNGDFKPLMIKLVLSAAVCGATVGIILLPTKELYWWIGAGNLAVMGTLASWHFVLAILGICKGDKQAFPMLYATLYAGYFGSWAAAVATYSNGDEQLEMSKNIEMLAVFAGGFLLEVANVVINMCTPPSKRERLASTSFGENIEVLAGSKTTEY